MASTDLTWYWHRFRAMSPVEMALHFRRRVRQAADARTVQAAMATGETVPGAFPRVPQSETAPESLRGAVRLEADAILSGSWRAFGHLDLSVDDPPRWQHDYLAGHDLETAASAFSLDHRALPAGADIKVVWELSRWHHLVRLAMAAHLLQDRRALAEEARLAGRLGDPQSALPGLELDQRAGGGHPPDPVRLDRCAAIGGARPRRQGGPAPGRASGRLARASRAICLAAPVVRILGQQSSARRAGRLPGGHGPLARARERRRTAGASSRRSGSGKCSLSSPATAGIVSRRSTTSSSRSSFATRRSALSRAPDAPSPPRCATG